MTTYCCGNPPPTPGIEVGTQVHRKMTDRHPGVRVGGAERYIVKYISDHNVILAAYRLNSNPVGSADSFISEDVLRRSKFDEEYEVCPGA